MNESLLTNHIPADSCIQLVSTFLVKKIMKKTDNLPMSNRMRRLVYFIEKATRKPVYAMSEKDRAKFNNIKIPDNIITRKMFGISVKPSEIRELIIPVQNGEIAGTWFVPNKIPDTHQQKTPAILYLHGGGWVLSTKAVHRRICEKLSVLLGIPVLTVEYRLAPEYKFPTAAEDAYNSLVWLHNHADELVINREALYVMGSSAGGNLAAVISLMARDREGPKLRGQILAYPAIGAEMNTESYKLFEEGPIITKKDMEFFITSYSNSKDDFSHPYFSPILASTHKGLPEALIITAEYDLLRDDGAKYAEVLRKAGVSVTYHMCKQTIHGFLVYLGAAGIEDADRLLNEFINRSTST